MSTVSRNEIARRWGVTSTQAQRVLEKAGVHAEIDPVTRAYSYDVKQVEAIGYKRVRPKWVCQKNKARVGRVAAKVFRCVKRGMVFGDIVIELEEDPHLILEFYEIATRDPEELTKELREKREQAEHERRLGRLNARHSAKMRRMAKSGEAA